MAKSLITPVGLACFPNLFEARQAVPGQGDPRYSLIILFDETAQKQPEFKELQDQIAAAISEKWGVKPPANLRMPIRKAEEKGEYAGFTAGKVFIAPWSKQKPGLVDHLNSEVHVKDDVWAGQLVRAYVRPFAYDTSGNRGAGIMLEHVQIVKKDMPRIDGRKAATEAFAGRPLATADDEV